MKRVLRVIFMTFLFLEAFNGRAEAGNFPPTPWIQKLKVIGIIDSGGVKDLTIAWIIY